MVHYAFIGCLIGLLPVETRQVKFNSLWDKDWEGAIARKKQPVKLDYQPLIAGRKD